MPSQFLAHSGKPLASIELADLQSWDTSLVADRPASRVRRLSAAKSLLTFAHKLGAISTDPGSAMRLAKVTETEMARILTEADVQRMIGAEPNPQRKLVLRLLYLCGLRASEAAALRCAQHDGGWEGRRSPRSRQGREAAHRGRAGRPLAGFGCVDLGAPTWCTGGAGAGRSSVRSAIDLPDGPAGCEARRPGARRVTALDAAFACVARPRSRGAAAGGAEGAGPCVAGDDDALSACPPRRPVGELSAGSVSRRGGILTARALVQTTHLQAAARLPARCFLGERP